MVLDSQDIENVSPKTTHRETSGGGKSSVMDYIQNMTITSPIKEKYSGKVSWKLFRNYPDQSSYIIFIDVLFLE